MDDLSTLLRDDAKPVDKRDGLNSVMGWLTGQTDKVPIVLDNERPFGIINERALMARNLDPQAKIGPYVTPTGALTPDSSVDDAVHRMSEHRAPHLPVADKRGKFAGYIAATDLAREAIPDFTAVEACLPVQVLTENNTMGDALNAFTKEYVDFLPVVNAAGRVVGVLPRRAVLAMEFNSGSRGRKDAGGEKFTMLHDPVHGFMDSVPVVVKPETPREQLLEILDESGYAIVQREDGHLVGVATPATLFRANGVK